VATALGLGLVAVLLGAVVYGQASPPPAAAPDEDLRQAIEAAIASTVPPPARSAEVYELILPSLVYIQTATAGAALGDTGDGPFGVGSGVIVTDGGAILTAHHVVADATLIEVVFTDGTEAEATIVSAEPENDIAVLQPDRAPEVIVPAVLGSTGGLRVGDEAYTVGNPLGLLGSMSAGVISGFDRSMPRGGSGEQIDGLIQFDAAVNPGSSGGPLLNRDGQVVGIVTALANPTEQDSFVGIGFAVPISTASAAAGGPPQ
jgi:S1-C subfamily serine protease